MFGERSKLQSASPSLSLCSTAPRLYESLVHEAELPRERLKSASLAAGDFLARLTAHLKHASRGRFGHEKAAELQTLARQSAQYTDAVWTALGDKGTGSVPSHHVQPWLGECTGSRSGAQYRTYWVDTQSRTDWTWCALHVVRTLLFDWQCSLNNSCYAAGAGSGNWIVINCLKEACKAARYIWALS